MSDYYVEAGSKEDTQYESRLVAQQISKVMGELYPVSWKALVDG